ncbi:hypothetical protein CYMTET_36399 [Cymbomonas tetramitiformis]|uniref:Uncharacterized protein n=1 Tax=Cymbomonas tetramitiformis TaxID=36881 RepID=A0AAE0CHJ7_9CHLO|nr:hypothetical protein CYMTET_36399 [Cymbomonas tetramitiformis]
MAAAYGIDEGVSMARPAFTSAHLQDIKAYTDQTKKAVGRKWAEESTRQGIAHAKKGSYSDALKCYEQALELDPKHRDAYVARGAAYANQGNLTGACEEFRMALKIDPENQNAAKYLAATRHKLGLNETALPSSAAAACSPHPGDLGDPGRSRAALPPNAHPRANFTADVGAQKAEQEQNTESRDGGRVEGLVSSSDMVYEEEIQRAVADAVARERKRKRKVSKARKEKKGRKRKDKKDKKAKKRKRRRDKDAKRRRHADLGRETSFGAGRDSASASGSSSGDGSDSESETDDERPPRLTSSVQIEAPTQPPTPTEASSLAEAMTRKVSSPIIWKVDS